MFPGSPELLLQAKEPISHKFYLALLKSILLKLSIWDYKNRNYQSSSVFDVIFDSKNAINPECINLDAPLKILLGTAYVEIHCAWSEF